MSSVKTSKKALWPITKTFILVFASSDLRPKLPVKTRKLSLELPWLWKDEPHPLCPEIDVYMHRTLGPSRV